MTKLKELVESWMCNASSDKKVFVPPTVQSGLIWFEGPQKSVSENDAVKKVSKFSVDLLLMSRKVAGFDPEGVGARVAEHVLELSVPGH